MLLRPFPYRGKINLSPRDTSYERRKAENDIRHGLVLRKVFLDCKYKPRSAVSAVSPPA